MHIGIFYLPEKKKLSLLTVRDVKLKYRQADRLRLAWRWLLSPKSSAAIAIFSCLFIKIEPHLLAFKWGEESFMGTDDGFYLTFRSLHPAAS